jgi:hypothetical protein
MTIKKANKTVNIKKPEHKKTAVKPALSSDKIYRKLYAHPQMIEDLIQNFVKERFVEHIDFSTLKEQLGTDAILLRAPGGRRRAV